MSNAFKTVLIEESAIADLTPEETFGVYSGAGEKTFQKFLSTSASNNSLIWNIQVPSESVVVSRHPILQSDINFTINITNPVPNGVLCFNLGATDAFQAFPLQSLFTNYSVMINNTSMTTNLQDVLPQVMTMYDKRQLYRYNSTTPAYPDNSVGLYSSGVGTSNNPLGSVYDMGYDTNFAPRGSFQMRGVFPARFVGGVYQDNSLVSTGVANETWKIYVFATVSEPVLCLSPFTDIGSDSVSGLLGVNTITLTCNIDSSCKRLWSTANYAVVANALVPYITSINLGTAGAPGGAGVISTSSNGFENTYMLMEFLTLQPSQASRISSKSVVGTISVPRYITPNVNLGTFAPNAQFSGIASQNIQLNSVPDLFIICIRQQMSTQSWANTSGYLTLTGCNISFNNKSGILASASQVQLFNLSQKNSSDQSWQQFSGGYYGNSVDGKGANIPSIGSLLVLNPALDFGLDDSISSGSLGQYNFMITLNGFNQYPYTVAPEIVVITANSGLFCVEAGVSQTYEGILSKTDVLNAKSQRPVVDSEEYQRLVGGKFSNMGVGRVLKKFRKKAVDRSSMPSAMSGGILVGGKKGKLGKYL